MIHVNDKCYRHEHEPMLPVIDEETRLLVNRQQQSLTITSGDQQWLKNNKTSIVITYVTSSDQRLWECVRRRINAVVYTDTLNDFPSWLATSKNQPFVIHNRGFYTERYFSDKIHASLIEDYIALRRQFP